MSLVDNIDWHESQGNYNDPILTPAPSPGPSAPVEAELTQEQARALVRASQTQEK